MTKEESQELVLQWRDLLMAGGFDVTPYMVEEHTALLSLSEKWKIMELKDFVLDPYFAQGKVQSFEMNNYKWYPEGSAGYLQQQAAREQKKYEQTVQEGLSQGQLPGFVDIVAQYKARQLTVDEARVQVTATAPCLCGWSQMRLDI